MSKGKTAIIGIGEVPTGTYPQRTHWDIIGGTGSKWGVRLLEGYPGDP